MRWMQWMSVAAAGALLMMGCGAEAPADGQGLPAELVLEYGKPVL